MSPDPEPTELPALPALPVTDQSATHAASGHGHDGSLHVLCENCGTELQGPFCHRCGQHDIDFHRSFGHMFLDALENFFHFDAKLFHNIITLLFRPGRLTAEFNAGKRAAQMPPFRLYLFVSVLFFFISFLGAGSDASGTNLRLPDTAEARAGLTEAIQGLASETSDPAAKQRLLGALEKLRDPTLQSAALTDEQLRDMPAVLAKQIRRELVAEEARRKKVQKTGDGNWVRIDEKDRKTDTAMARYLTEKGQSVLDHQHELQEAFLHALPKMLLVCLPFMALYTRVLFRKTGYVYLQHLIIALHFHTFVYLWWLVSRGWGELMGLWSPGFAGLVGFGTWLWMCLYPFLMLRRLFGQSWIRTTLKTFLLAGTYGLTLGGGFLLTAIIVFLII